MAYFLSPVGNDQQCDANGNPLVGGKIYTYIAGSSTPVATYTDNATGTQQANPIILNSLGLPASPIWMTNGVSVKFVIQDSAGVLIRTIDNVSGVNDVAFTASEWVASGIAPTYISGTSFSMAGDQTQQFQPGRRILSANTAGTRYSTILTSVFSAGSTTITVLNDSGILDSGLSSVSYGLLSVTNSSIPYVSSLASSGYQKLPGGLILQWGSLIVPGGGQTVTFPIAFPSVCYGVYTGTYYATNPSNAYVSLTAFPTTTNFGITTNTGTPGASWFAIGK